MLDEGVAAGLRYMDVECRHIFYAEREAYPCSVLEARMEEGSMDSAPIWCGDFRELPISKFCGLVDLVVAGFPCQDLSLAGRRAGLDGKRSGLFFDILDIAHACGARYLFLENVAGIASATASVVDEAEGALDERAAARVLGELADRGWNAEWLTLSASDVGASHGRERWFCWAWRDLDDPKRPERRADHAGGTGRQQGHDGGWPETHGGSWQSSDALGHTQSQRCREAGQCGAPAAHAGTGGAGANLADSECCCDERRGIACDMARTGCAAERETRERERCGPAVDGSRCAVADASSARQQGREQCGTCTDHRGGAQAHGSVEQLRRPLFAPGPADARWPAILREWPWLAPALPGKSGGPRLNPCFGEFLMGWPIFWSHINAEQSSDQKDGAARNTAEWRVLLQMQLNHFLGEAPRGLFQAPGCGDYLPILPREAARGRDSAEASSLCDLRGDIQANDVTQSSDMREAGLPGRDGKTVGAETMGWSNDDCELRKLQSGVSEAAPETDDVRTLLWKQTRMEEEAMSTRAQRLKCVGNGVVALCAAAAVVQLVRRMKGA